MRFTMKRDAKDVDALATRIAGKKAAASRRNMVKDRILTANPHLTEFEALPPDTLIVLPDDVPDADDEMATDPRSAAALQIANDTVDAAREALKTGFERDDARADEREAQIRQVQAGSTDRAVTASLEAELKRVRERREARRVSFDRSRTALESTAEALRRLGRGEKPG